MNIDLHISSKLSEHYDFIYMVIQTAVNKHAYQFASQPLSNKIDQDIMTCLSILPVNVTVRTSFIVPDRWKEPALRIDINVNEFVHITAQIAKDFRSPF